MSYDSGDETGGQIGAWAPGTAPYMFSEGLGFYLPKGGDLVIEIHYHLDGKEHMDQSSVGLYLSKKPLKKQVQSLFVGSMDVNVPAGQNNYWRHVFMNVSEDMEIIDATPHMHYIGKEFIMVATLPDGTRKNLLKIDQWDFRYQDVYIFDKPVKIPKGSRIDCWFSYDNSAENSANPNSPPKPIKWGWNTDDEMLEVYITIITDKVGPLMKDAYNSWLQPAYSKGPLSKKDMAKKLMNGKYR